MSLVQAHGMFGTLFLVDELEASRVESERQTDRQTDSQSDSQSPSIESSDHRHTHAAACSLLWNCKLDLRSHLEERASHERKKDRQRAHVGSLFASLSRVSQRGSN
jgi:hypothetical protein